MTFVFQNDPGRAMENNVLLDLWIMMNKSY